MYARVSVNDTWKFDRPSYLGNYAHNSDVMKLRRDAEELKEAVALLKNNLRRAASLISEYQDEIAANKVNAKKHELLIDAYKSAVSLLDNDKVKCRNDECAICSDSLSSQDENTPTPTMYVCLLCRNATHLKCVEEWWKVANIEKTCPYCKQPPLEIT